MQTELGDESIIQTAVGHYRAGRFAISERLCRDAVTRDPANAQAIHLLGLLAIKAKSQSDAELLLLEAVRLCPEDARFRNDLGLVLSSGGKGQAAIAEFEEAVRLQPDFAEGYNNLGAVLRLAGRHDEAIAAYRTAVAAAPNFAEAHYNLGNALRERKCFDEAIESYRKAIALRPDFSQAYSNLGVALKDTAQLAESIWCTRRALEIGPDLIAASNLLCTLHYPAESNPKELFAEHRRWNDQYGRVYAREILAHANDRDPNRRVRIGYVSPDLNSHPVGCCLLPVLKHHNRGAFEIFCYSDVTRADAVTGQFGAHADTWRPTASISDEKLAQVIGEDRIDILVDLAVHTNGNRLPVFARKPAPIQVTWLGWPGTTGLDTMDYRLSDPYLDPPTRSEWLYSERTATLPHSFWCYASLSDGPAINELPALRNGFVTFGCFNNFCKVTERTLELWAGAMLSVAGSKLLVMAPRGSARDRLSGFLAQRGVDRSRVGFVDRQPHEKYLELYQQVDVCLDTVPYAGHTTSMDSFWMGVPVVSLVGEIPVWRAGLSILSNLGMPGMAAHTPEQYLGIAAALAADLNGLSALRATLRQRMEASPIMDAPRYARNLERVFRLMWQAWCAGSILGDRK